MRQFSGLSSFLLKRVSVIGALLACAVLSADTARAAKLYDVGTVPEPASLGLLGFGSLMLLRRRRR